MERSSDEAEREDLDLGPRGTRSEPTGYAGDCCWGSCEGRGALHFVIVLLWWGKFQACVSGSRNREMLHAWRAWV